jgi:hypothetical protein
MLTPPLAKRLARPSADPLLRVLNGTEESASVVWIPAMRKELLGFLAAAVQVRVVRRGVRAQPVGHRLNQRGAQLAGFVTGLARDAVDRQRIVAIDPEVAHAVGIAFFSEGGRRGLTVVGR